MQVRVRRESCNNLAEGGGQHLGRVSVDVVSDATGGGTSRWKTFGERVIYDNPWVWLGQVDVELPDGCPPPLRMALWGGGSVT
jgi:hypothetical protein